MCYRTSLCHEWFKVLFSSNNWIWYSVLHGLTSLQLRTIVKYMLFFSILMVFIRCISLFKLVLFLHNNAFIRIHLCRSTKLYIFLSFFSMTSPIKHQISPLLLVKIYSSSTSPVKQSYSKIPPYNHLCDVKHFLKEKPHAYRFTG